jgi:hypothetical protein
VYARVVSGALDRIVFVPDDSSAVEIAGYVISTENESVLRLNHVVWVRTSSSIIDLEQNSNSDRLGDPFERSNDVLIPIRTLIEQFGWNFRRLDAGWGVIKRGIE